MKMKDLIDRLLTQQCFETMAQKKIVNHTRFFSVTLMHPITTDRVLRSRQITWKFCHRGFLCNILQTQRKTKPPELAGINLNKIACVYVSNFSNALMAYLSSGRSQLWQPDRWCTLKVRRSAVEVEKVSTTFLGRKFDRSQYYARLCGELASSFGELDQLEICRWRSNKH